MVIGGKESESHPYFVQVWSTKSNEDYRISYEFCGGALIDREWVLTAAHCLKDYSPSDINLSIGEKTPTIPNEFDNNQISAKVCAIYKHPDYIRGAYHILPINQLCAGSFAMLGYLLAYAFSKTLKKVHKYFPFFIIPIVAMIGFVFARDLTSWLFFNEPTYNDIGLVQLCNPLPKDHPTISLAEKYVKPHSDVLIMGFGSQDGQPIESLHEGKNKVISNTKCSANFYFGGFNWIDEGSICFSSSPEISKNINLANIGHPTRVSENISELEEEIESVTIACKGDSGSPALLSMSEDNGEPMKLIGLSSWGSRPCEKHPSVYTRVSYYLEWVYDTISGIDD